MPDLGFPLPEPLFDRLFNLQTGTIHEYHCPACDTVTRHYSTTHSGLRDNVVEKFLSRVFEDLSGLGNLFEGKPYVCTICRTVRFE